MANLTKKQRAEIAEVLRHVQRTFAMIHRPDIAVGRLGGFASTTEHFTRPDGATFYAITKDIGSDLQGLDFAISGLTRLLAPKE